MKYVINQFRIDQAKSLNLYEYEPRNKVGEGSFGRALFVAKISKLVIDFSDVCDQNATNFLNEVRIISQLNHPSILKFIGFSLYNFKNQPKPVIVTEFVTNGSLENILELENRSISQNEWNYTKKLINIYGIASAMLYLHHQEILHLDLKASNVFVDDNFYPKLADFGMSKDLRIINQKDGVKDKKTRIIFKGTPTHAAPEIWINSEYTKAADVYAFALTVFEIMTNDKPFKNVKGIYNIMHEVSILGKRPEFVYPIPNRYKELIQDCWLGDPKKRPTFDQIVDWLKNDSSFVNDANVDGDEFLNYIESVDGCENINPSKIKKVKKIIKRKNRWLKQEIFHYQSLKKIK